MGEHHCNICTIISGGVVVGVGLDLMDHMSYLSLGCAGSYDGKFSGTRSKARCEAETCQNVFTDPQKPMKVEPGLYPLNGADENSICLTTVDFALTYFIVSGELERSGVPVNLVINDAGGLSVLTSWAAGKFSGTSISKYIQENIESKVKSRKLIIPGKVAVLKGDLEAKLPGWEIIVAPLEAVQLVKFLKDMKEAGEL